MRCLPSCRCQELKATEKSFSLAKNALVAGFNRNYDLPDSVPMPTIPYNNMLYIIINPWKLGKPICCKIYGFDAVVS